MRLGAMLAKEWRSRMRSWRSLVTITLYLGTLAAVGLGTLRYLRDQGRSSGLEAAAIGPQVFGVLAAFQLILLVFVVPSLTAGAIAGEKERQTFDLLLTTRLSAVSIVAGKLVMSLAYVLLLLLLSLPLFGLAFLFGGVSLAQLGLTFLILGVTALAIGSVSLLISTIFRRVQLATIVSYLLAFGLVLGSGIFSSLLFNSSVPASPTNPNAAFFTSPPDPSPLAYFSPLASLATVVTTPYGSAVQIPFLPLPNGLPDEYFNRSFANTNPGFRGGPSGVAGYIPGSQYSLPALWPIQTGLYGLIIVVSLGLAVGLVRPRRWLPRRRQKPALSRPTS